MGRGLSQLQKDILGVAFVVNAHTQGGTAKVKEGQPLDGYRIPTSDHAGPVDYTTPLGVYSIYGIIPVDEVTRDTQRGPVIQYVGDSGYFANTPEVKRAKAAASRAVSRLVSRELLVYRPGDVRSEEEDQWRIVKFLGGYGYLLTPSGMDVGRDHPKPVPMIDECLKVFQITATTTSWSAPGIEHIDYRDLRRVRRSLAATSLTVSNG